MDEEGIEEEEDREDGLVRDRRDLISIVFVLISGALSRAYICMPRHVFRVTLSLAVIRRRTRVHARTHTL